MTFKTSFIVLTLLISQCVLAQTYTHMASLPVVDKDGFYRVMISPQLGAYLSTDFSNIRLIDSKNKEVPFLFEEESATYSTSEFQDYEIAKKKQKPGCCTSLILKNILKKPINNISLVIKNADVEKEATLLGSDDQRQWYALKHSFTIAPINNPSGTTEVKIVDFPLSNYKFYALHIDDSTSAPLNILRAGYYDLQTELGKYSTIPGIKLSSADSVKEKSTYVRIEFENPTFIDKLELKITDVPFYKRHAQLFEPRVLIHAKGKKRIKENYNELIDEIELSSTHAATLSLPGRKTKSLLLVIENQDNPSLTIENATAFQLNRYIVAWLKKNESYTIKFGKNLQRPTYDLGYFKDSIPANTTVIQAQSVKIIPMIKSQDEHRSFFTNRIIIWIAIIGVIGILGFMSIRMIRETDNKS